MMLTTKTYGIKTRLTGAVKPLGTTQNPVVKNTAHSGAVFSSHKAWIVNFGRTQMKS